MKNSHQRRALTGGYITVNILHSIAETKFLPNYFRFFQNSKSLGNGAKASSLPCSLHKPQTTHLQVTLSHVIYQNLNKKKSLGNDLLSQGAAPQVPSALADLTTGFGMLPGVPPPRKSPRDLIYKLDQLNRQKLIINFLENHQVLNITS